MKPMEHPEEISFYFKSEWRNLLIVTVSGLFYNIGLLAGPLFDGKLAQCLMDILNGTRRFSDMAKLVLVYVVVISAVQIGRYIKRLYVRRFANNINRSMKHILYGNLIQKNRAELEQENVGAIITKAIADVDACAEGLRKFTTEVFDTGIALLGYAALLLWYDWRLALLCSIFPPFSYLIADKMKVVVQSTGAEYKESAGRLSAAVLDRVSGAVTYRVYGCEEQRNREYETHLIDYEKKAVRANIWSSALPPLYHALSMAGVLFILSFGVKNVLGTGWSRWNIAAFTTFLSCFAKLSVKSSKAAKLFNSVQKAQVSWRRIRPLMNRVPDDSCPPVVSPASLHTEHLSVRNPEGTFLFDPVSFTAEPGEIIAVIGPVACGKTSFGKAFLCEQDYLGSIRFNHRELSGFSPETRRGIIGYLGHDCELFSDTIENNILLGIPEDPAAYLSAVCFEEDLKQMPDGIQTRIGSGGILLSGGQKQRVALARTLAHPRPVYILDDPFSALDRETEQEIFSHIRELAKSSIVLLISHRLYLFPQCSQVIWMEHGHTMVSTHEGLMQGNPSYAKLYRTQSEGGDGNET